MAHRAVERCTQRWRAAGTGGRTTKKERLSPSLQSLAELYTASRALCLLEACEMVRDGLRRRDKAVVTLLLDVACGMWACGMWACGMWACGICQPSVSGGMSPANGYGVLMQRLRAWGGSSRRAEKRGGDARGSP